jgi:hypothetical protein
LLHVLVIKSVLRAQGLSINAAQLQQAEGSHAPAHDHHPTSMYSHRFFLW